MSNQEAGNIQPQEQVEQPLGSIFNKKMGRRGALGTIATAGAGLAGMALVGCGGDDAPDTNADNSPEANATEVKEELFGIGEAKILLEKLPGEAEEIAIGNAFPRGLVIRRGATLTVKGILQSETEGRKAVISVTDPQRLDKDGAPKIFTGIIPDKIELDLQQEGDFSFENLAQANGATYGLVQDKPSLTLKEKRGSLPMIASDTAASETNQAGVFFIDRDPLKKDHPLLKYPVISTPDKSILPDGGSITQLEDGRVVTKDASGKLIARAITQRDLEWRWTKKEHLISDYCPSELADALDFTIGSHGFWNLIGDPNWAENFLSIANKMRIDDPFWNKNQFVQNMDWGKIMGDWDNAQKQLEAGTIPFESEIFNQQWVKRTDSMLDFAKKYDLPVNASKLYWWGDFREELYSDKYSIDEKKKMVEFMAKAKVLKYKGKIKEWTTTPEMATGYEPWIDAKQRGLLESLGGIEMMHNINVWAKQMDPEVTTVIVEDRLLEDTSFAVSQRVSQRFFGMLDEFKKRGTPIDNVAPENNFWVGDPPKKGKMTDVLKKIKALGFGISMAQTTISMSETSSDKGRPRTVGTILDREQAQSDINSGVLEAYFETGSEFGYHSTSDIVDWIASIVPDASSTIISRNYQPKKAYIGTVNLLKKKLLS